MSHNRVVEGRPWEDDEVRAWRATCRDFFEREVVPHQDRWRHARQVDESLWTKAGDVGLLCCGVPQLYGGGGGTFAHELVVIEELARSLETGFGFGVHSTVVAQYLVEYGTEAQKLKWLPRLASGKSIAAVAMTEPRAGSDLRGIRARAVAVEEGYSLTGQKTFVSNGSVADLILVAAKTGSESESSGISLFMVDVGAASGGFSRSSPFRKIGQHSSGIVELAFDSLIVSSDALIGEEGAGLSYLMQQLPRERLVVAAGAVVAMERAVELTIDYTKGRELFGSPSFSMQNTRFVLAECATTVAIGRTFLDECVLRILRDGLDTATASMAKFWLTDAQGEVIDRCLQLYGGYGYMEEYPIARMYVDARVQRIYGGANEVMKELIARSL